MALVFKGISSENPLHRVVFRGVSIENESNTSIFRGVSIENTSKSSVFRGVSVEWEEIIKYNERSISYVTKVSIPEQEEVNRGFKECCYNNIVLADPISSDSEKNDFTSFWFKRQTAGDTCDFVLVDASTLDEYALNDNTYGEFVDFDGYATQPNLKTIKVQWQKVLNILGAGHYYIRKDTSVSGVANTIKSNTYQLRQYSQYASDFTIRIDSVFNGEMIKLGVDFSGTDYATSLRTKGYFGDRDVTYTQDNFVTLDYNTEQISISSENEYQMQTGLIPECITTELFDFMLFADEIYISDYNSNNHSYKYKLYPVQLSDNVGTRYFARARNAEINLKFKDRVVNTRKINC